MRQKYNIILFFLLLVVACKPETSQFSNVPTINLLKTEQIPLNGKDSIINITLTYTDGDGDIGLNENDTFAPYNFGTKFFHNLFIELYKIENGIASKIVIPFTTDTLNFNDRITNLTPTGKIKSISGEILIPIKALPYPGITPDSVYYTLQIADRKLNLSNKVTTPIFRFVF